MSDFSAGIMIESKHKELALEHLEKGSLLIQLNERWLCRLSENDFCSARNEEKYSPEVLALSAQIPLLHIIHAEDHGFEIGILSNSRVVFHCHVNYEQEMSWLLKLSEELLAQFQNFGCTKAECVKIQEILCGRDDQNETAIFEVFYELLELLGLSEFSFISYQYLHQNAEGYQVCGRK